MAEYMDLGGNHFARWTFGNAANWPHLPGAPTSEDDQGNLLVAIGITEYHPVKGATPTWPPTDENWEQWCGGGAMFCRRTNPTTERERTHAIWQVQAWDPLTISPSLLCKGGGRDTHRIHGHIQNGRWVKQPDSEE